MDPSGAPTTIYGETGTGRGKVGPGPQTSVLFGLEFVFLTRQPTPKQNERPPSMRGRKHHGSAVLTIMKMYLPI